MLNSWRWKNLWNIFSNLLLKPRMLYLRYSRYAPHQYDLSESDFPEILVPVIIKCPNQDIFLPDQILVLEILENSRILWFHLLHWKYLFPFILFGKNKIYKVFVMQLHQCITLDLIYPNCNFSIRLFFEWNNRTKYWYSVRRLFGKD